MEDGSDTPMDIDTAHSSSAVLNDDIIRIILEYLIEPYLYHPGTAELDPHSAPIFFTLRPFFLVSRSWCDYVRRLAVRHLYLDFYHRDDQYDRHSVYSQNLAPIQLIDSVTRHNLSSSIRYLALRHTDSCPHCLTERARGGLLKLLASATGLQTLIWFGGHYGSLSNDVLNLLRNSPSLGFRHTLTRLDGDYSGGGFSRLAALFPNIQSAKMSAYGEPLRRTVSLSASPPAQHRLPFEHLHLRTDGLFAEYQNGEATLSPGLILLQEYASCLESLVLNDFHWLPPTGSYFTSDLFPACLPRLRSLSLSHDGLLSGTVPIILSASPHLVHLEIKKASQNIVSQIPPSNTLRVLALHLHRAVGEEKFAVDLCAMLRGLSALRVFEIELDGQQNMDDTTEEELVALLLPVQKYCDEHSSKLYTSNVGVYDNGSEEKEEEKWPDAFVRPEKWDNFKEDLARLRESLEESESEESAEFSDPGE